MTKFMTEGLDMAEKLHAKYGLSTAIAMVIGIVIGSGVFFKAEKVLVVTGGKLGLGIFAWVIGGLIMICCAYTFAKMGTKYSKVNGIVDYAEATVGKKYAYYIGWIMATIYYPTLTSVLAWITARYTCVLLGFSIFGGECMTIACFYLILSYAINSLSPIIAGKVQVGTTVIKLIPLVGMAFVGTFVGLKNGQLATNFTSIVEPVSSSYGFFTALVATAFAYEGWIVATTINAELKNSKRNLPLTLIGGTFVIMAVYVLYYIGLSGAVDNIILMEGGESGAKIAFETIFSKVGGTLVFVFVIISCFGTLNGLMLANIREIYALAARNTGPSPAIFSQIDEKTNVPANSGILGLFIASLWLLYFYGANLTTPWFGFFSFDSSELPIVTIYACYIPIFIMFMIKEKSFNIFNRFVMPVLSICGCLFIIVASIFSHAIGVAAYLVIFAFILVIGFFCHKKKGELV